MKCPFCGSVNNKVIDSRLSRADSAVRRRRECLICTRRFTTYEQIEKITIMVKKRDGSLEAFDRDKMVDGVLKACGKDFVRMEEIKSLVDKVERELRNSGEGEVDSNYIGEIIMKYLREVDAAAYMRFASVYRSFSDVTDFIDEAVDVKEKVGR